MYSFIVHLVVVVNKSDGHLGTGNSGDFSDSEEEDTVSIEPQGGDETIPIPTTSLAPAETSENHYLPRPTVDSSEVSSHTFPREEEETLPTINPIARRHLKRVEQKIQQGERHFSLRVREKGINSKPP